MLVDNLECWDFDVFVLFFDAFNLFKGIFLFTSWDPAVSDWELVSLLQSVESCEAKLLLVQEYLVDLNQRYAVRICKLCHPLHIKQELSETDMSSSNEWSGVINSPCEFSNLALNLIHVSSSGQFEILPLETIAYLQELFSDSHAVLENYHVDCL